LSASAQYFENYVAEQREEILRWTICLAVVLAVHGLVGFYLRQSIETSEFGIDLPVVMLELPDVPPPPVEEKKEEPPPPPPEEEVKPPEPEPEVMPPEPPKPVVEDKPPPPPVVTIPRTVRPPGRADWPRISSASSATRSLRLITKDICWGAASCKAPGRRRSTKRRSPCWHAQTRCQSRPRGRQCIVHDRSGALLHQVTGLRPNATSLSGTHFFAEMLLNGHSTTRRDVI
jgi:hypothetical protein